MGGSLKFSGHGSGCTVKGNIDELQHGVTAGLGQPRLHSMSWYVLMHEDSTMQHTMERTP